MNCATCKKRDTCKGAAAIRYCEAEAAKQPPKRQMIRWERVVSDKAGYRAVRFIQMNEEARAAGRLYSMPYDGRSVCIISEAVPAFDNFGGHSRLFLPGYRKNWDTTVVYIPDDAYNAVDVAVTNYNKSLNGEQGFQVKILKQREVPAELPWVPAIETPLVDIVDVPVRIVQPLTEVLHG